MIPIPGAQIILLAFNENETNVINKALKVDELPVIVICKTYQNYVFSTLNRDSTVLEYQE